MKHSIVVAIVTSLIVTFLLYSIFGSPKKADIGIISGASMEHKGLYEGMEVEIVHNKPKVGDIVAFYCRKSGCPENHEMAKEVKSIDEKWCFWLEGRPGEYVRNGHIVHSLDSKTYGFLCGTEIEIKGVVKPKSSSYLTRI